VYKVSVEKRRLGSQENGTTAQCIHKQSEVLPAELLSQIPAKEQNPIVTTHYTDVSALFSKKMQS
jgi:hypothetical protein